MEILYQRCCGLDVHKKKITACLRDGRSEMIREYGTYTDEILDMAGWLLESECQIVAMESTGPYWKPIFNLLELTSLEIIVVNASHMKNVPGRKTDTKDSQWIAELLQNGLLRPSYIPDRDQRELREIVRYRKSLIEERAREVNRLEKILQGCNIKLSSCVSDLQGITSKNIIRALTTEDGVTEENIDALVTTKLKASREELLRATRGKVSKLQRQLLNAIMDHIEDMTRRIADMDKIIRDRMHDNDEKLLRLTEIKGIGFTTAEIILAEIGPDVSRFPTANHLSAWSGLCPGNNESAGKRKYCKTRKGNKTLKTALIQAAKAAVKDKTSFFHAQYQRIATRRGANRATVAVAHSILIAIYHMLKNGTHFNDLGADYYNKFNAEKKARYHIRVLQELGFSVVPVPATA